MKRYYLFLLLSAIGLGVFGQQNITLRIHHMLDASPFQFGTAATNSLGQSFKVSRLQYYIAEIEVIHDGGQYSAVDSTWILANASTMTVQDLGAHNVTNVEGIRFGIGVQSSVNHLDPSQYAMNHPLAPQSPSMHWGWSSGYRFVAIEGTAGNGFSQPFEIHGLEDANYFKTTVMTSGTLNGPDLVIDIDANYVEALRGIDVAAGPISHGGTGISLTALQNFRDHVFSASAVTGTAYPSTAGLQFAIAPNPSNGHFNVQIEAAAAHQNQLMVLDYLGRTVASPAFTALGTADVDITVPGCYLVALRHEGKTAASRRVVVAH